MSLPIGQPEYQHGTSPVFAVAYSWTQEQLGVAISGPITAAVFDDSGRFDIAAILAGVTTTDFELSNLARALLVSTEPEPWRVGEAIAEVYLTAHRECLFPWPDGRDMRKSGSSLPGADLVGLRAIGASHTFAFGEVKTSSEKKYPPWRDAWPHWIETTT